MKRQLKKPGYQPLLMMRARGFLGTIMGKHARQTRTLSKSSGAQVTIDLVGGEGG